MGAGNLSFSLKSILAEHTVSAATRYGGIKWQYFGILLEHCIHQDISCTVPLHARTQAY